MDCEKIFLMNDKALLILPVRKNIHPKVIKPKVDNIFVISDNEGRFFPLETTPRCLGFLNMTKGIK